MGLLVLPERGSSPCGALLDVLYLHCIYTPYSWVAKSMYWSKLKGTLGPLLIRFLSVPSFFQQVTVLTQLFHRYMSRRLIRRSRGVEPVAGPG